MKKRHSEREFDCIHGGGPNRVRLGLTVKQLPGWKFPVVLMACGNCSLASNLSSLQEQADGLLRANLETWCVEGWGAPRPTRRRS